MEALYGHLPGNPYHSTLQKGRGYAYGFTWLAEGKTTI